MTIPELVTALDYPTSALYVDAVGHLRYVGPAIAPDAPIRLAIAKHRTTLTELFTYAPGRRCVFTGCYRLVAAGSKIVCVEHRIVIDQELAALNAGHAATDSEAA